MSNLDTAVAVKELKGLVQEGRVLDDADTSTGHAESTVVEGGHRDLEAFTRFTKAVAVGDANIAQKEFACVAGA